jgi:hypothetical protein
MCAFATDPAKRFGGNQVLHSTFLWSFKGTKKKPKPRIQSSAKNVIPISPDSIMVLGAHMGPTVLDAVSDHETQTSSPTAVSPQSSPKAAIELTTHPAQQLAANETSPSNGLGHGEAAPAGFSDITNLVQQDVQDLDELLLQFKLAKDADDIKANGVNAAADLFEIEPAMMSDLILTPIAKAKLKKLLRHVNAPGWNDESLTSAPAVNPNSSMSPREISLSQRFSFRPSEVSRPKPVASPPRASGSDVSFSTRPGLGQTPPSSGPAPLPPPRTESFARGAGLPRPPASKLAAAFLLQKVR